MRAAVFSEFGAPDVVTIADVAVPEPGPGEVRLQVAACAMNHLDVWVRRGLPVETPMPHIGGADVAVHHSGSVGSGGFRDYVGRHGHRRCHEGGGDVSP